MYLACMLKAQHVPAHPAELLQEGLNTQLTTVCLLWPSIPKNTQTSLERFTLQPPALKDLNYVVHCEKN